MRKYWAIGLMSGTSMDGVDAAEVKSDGLQIFEFGNFISVPYPKKFKEKLRKLIEQKGSASPEFIAEVERELTEYHAEAVKELMEISNKVSTDYDLIGFHGHTVDHKPHERYTWQIGNGRLLADLTGINVVCNFRKNDVLLGGQGAPLIPLFHKAIVDFPFYPAVILNVGGVANITYLTDEGLLAFDTGPGNALIDDYVFEKTGNDYDEGGELAKKGKVNNDLLNNLMSNVYFKRRPPKSLDRDDFKMHVNSLLLNDEFKDMKLEDVVATLSQFTIESIFRSFDLLHSKPKTVFMCGGGLKNNYILEGLEKKLSTKIFNISVVDGKLNPDAIEAQGFGFLAIRSKIGLPITFASTTGIKMSSATGGVFYPA